MLINLLNYDNMWYTIETNHNDKPVRYQASSEDGDIFHLYLQSENERNNDAYVPEKMLIRKKGKIWISDVEDRRELVDKLVAIICQQHFSII
jgi:hypothetical protein